MNFNKMRTWAEVNLDNFRNNIEVIKKHTGNDVKFTAVIKADAYGHGACVLAKEALGSGVDFLAVACMSEAIEIRKAKINHPVLVLSHTICENAEDIIEYNVIPTVFDRDLPEKLSKYAKEKNAVIKVHIKLDTGMTRLGFDVSDVEKTVNDIVYISKLDNIEVDGIFTHFADADNENGNYTEIQFERYIRVIKELEKRGINIPNMHACNSAATIANKDMYLTGVRCGIILYGYYPEKYLESLMPGIKPVMEIKSKLLQIREIPKDVTVSYGRTYKSETNKRVGVVPIGYADGYSRLLSNDFYVLICGKKAKILGRVCMDQMMVDLTYIPEAKEGTKVTIIGRDGELSITADDIAEKLGTISYEILCDIGKRVPRVYIKNGEFIGTVNYLE